MTCPNDISPSTQAQTCIRLRFFIYLVSNNKSICFLPFCYFVPLLQVLRLIRHMLIMSLRIMRDARLVGQIVEIVARDRIQRR